MDAARQDRASAEPISTFTTELSITCVCHPRGSRQVCDLVKRARRSIGLPEPEPDGAAWRRAQRRIQTHKAPRGLRGSRCGAAMKQSSLQQVVEFDLTFKGVPCVFPDL